MNQNVNIVPGGSICLCRHFFFFFEKPACAMPSKVLVTGPGDGDFFSIESRKVLTERRKIYKQKLLPFEASEGMLRSRVDCKGLNCSPSRHESKRSSALSVVLLNATAGTRGAAWALA